MNQLKAYLFLLSLNLSILLKNCSAVDPHFIACQRPINCKFGPNISFPFYIQKLQKSYCGYPGFGLKCSDHGFPLVTISENDYIVQHISYTNHTVQLQNLFLNTTTSAGCYNISAIKNVTLDNDPFDFVRGKSTIYLLSKCNKPLPAGNLSRYKIGCDENDLAVAMFPDDSNFESALRLCKNHVTVPVNERKDVEVGVLMRRGFQLKWTASHCRECADSGGFCGFNETDFHFKCFCPDRPHAASCKPPAYIIIAGKNKTGMIVGSVVGGAVLVSLGVAFIICCHNKGWKNSSHFISRNLSFYPSSKHDVEGGSKYFGIPLFSYTELVKATNNFDSSRELGDGGFGTVYHGKLEDGREVAVKRLYEHNGKRMEQFKNEVEILTRLRHQNLVTLYGCTSKHSRELLLVYEYISNGTLADHLHGEKAKEGCLTWPIRMNIAVETANALAYLHASDIIHRDVKTNNILLDNNFCVKVADFGLSRLFPGDVTHVSTAPQGTPGYVDPEYHECYQLTGKSDVYSFGVVLAELISSMPAVDITRHRHEINLANLAVNRIQRSAFDDLIDTSIGFASDEGVRRMTTSVAELTFRCLQVDKDMRPTMEEALETLKYIQAANLEYEKINGNISSGQVPPSPESDNIVLLKKMEVPPSPVSVTLRWVSSSSSNSTSTSICG